MKLSKQALLGTGVLLGGSMLLYATIHQINSGEPAQQTTDSTTSVASATTGMPDAAITNAPLTADIQTEKNILAQKQKEREARVQQQEQAAQQYLTEQQRIEAEALARSRAENQLYTNSQASDTPQTAIAEPVVKPRPVNDAVATVTEDTRTQRAATATVAQTQPKKPTVTPPAVMPKPVEVAKQDAVKAAPQPTPQTTTPPPRPGSYQVKRGEGLIGLSRRYNVPVEALAAANGLSQNASLHVGQTLQIPSASQVNRLKQEAVQKEQQRLAEIARKKQEAAQKEQQRLAEIARKKQEALQKQQEKQNYQAAQQKLKDARQTVKETDAKGNFGVQVALAADEAKAQEIAKKLQAAGYKVKTSKTTRGVRVVVGPETGKVAALALKDKVNSDPRIGMNNAWVLYW